MHTPATRPESHTSFVVFVSGPRLGLALLASGLLCTILATRVAIGFEATREKLVTQAQTTPADAARIVVDPVRSSNLRPPFAAIARIRSDAPTLDRFAFRVDGQPLCTRDVPGGGSSHRIDCAWAGGWEPDVAHTIEIQGGASRWTLEYLELATHHGATRSYDLIVVPADSRQYRTPSRPLVAAAFFTIAFVLLLPQPRIARPARVIYGVVSASLALLLLLSLVSPYLSPYAVLLSAEAFWTSVLVATAPRLWFAGHAAWHMSKRTAWGPTVACLAAGAFVLALYGAVAAQRLHEDYHGNYSGFIQLAKANFDRHPALSGRSDVRSSLILREKDGYDGQFMYYAAFDPFLLAYRQNPSIYRLFIDAPPYRFSRIGFSLLTKVFSGDRWALYPATMSWLILISLFACGCVLALIACDAGASPAWGLLIAVVPAFWQSVQTSLPEPIAGALLLGGYLCLQRDRWRWAGGFFALSLLIRETGAILVACLVVQALASNRRRQGLALAAISFAPLLAWRAYVWWILAPDWGAQALWFDPQGLGPPFAGIVRLWTAIRQGEYFPGLSDVSRAGIWYPVVLIGGLAAALAIAIRRLTALGTAAVLYGAMAVSLAYPKVWSHVANAQRGTFELFLVLALVSLQVRHDARPIRWGLAAFWIGTTAYVLFGAHDADYIRHAAFSAVT